MECRHSAGAFARAPEWLLSQIITPSRGNGVPLAEWRTLVTNGVAKGQRDCSIAKLSGHLLRRYVDPTIVRELMQCWNLTRCTPPLPPEDVGRIVASIASREQKKCNGYEAS